MVPYTKILGQATKLELLMFCIGHLCAALMGLIIPVFQFFISDLFDSFKPNNSKEEQMQGVSKAVLILSCMAAGMWILGYLYWVLLAKFSVNVSLRIKEKYLRAILNQEPAWFDQVNYTELSARIAREC